MKPWILPACALAAWTCAPTASSKEAAAPLRYLEKLDRGLFALWWDGDLLRELLDQNFVNKWNWRTQGFDTLLICRCRNGR